MQYKKNMLLVVPCLVTWLAQGDCTKALQGTFDDFIKEVVVAEDQEHFNKFYGDVVSQLKKDKESIQKNIVRKQEHYVEHLKKLGSCGLETKNPKFSLEVKSYFIALPGKTNADMSKKAQAFLFRYGAYEEFLHKKAEGHNSILAKAGSYVKGIGSKVSGWVSNLKRSKPA